MDKETDRQQAAILGEFEKEDRENAEIDAAIDESEAYENRLNPNQALLPNGDYALGVALPTARLLLTSSGRILPLKQDFEQIGTDKKTGEPKFAPKIPLSYSLPLPNGDLQPCAVVMETTENQISSAGLKRFRLGVNIQPTAFFERTVKFLSRFYDAGDFENEPAALYHDCAWLLATYYAGITGKTQYRALSGKPGAGKSIRTACLAALGFKGEFSTSLTLATIFRLVAENMATLGIDELDKQNPDTRAEIMGLLNAGNTRGATVPRTEGDKVRRVVRYPVFSAKIVNANNPKYLDSFAARCFEESMLPTLSKLGDWYSRTEGEEKELRELRDDFWIFALQNAKSYQEVYNRLRAENGTSRSETLPLGALAALELLAPEKVPLVKKYLAATRQLAEEAGLEEDWAAHLFYILFKGVFTNPAPISGQEQEQATKAEAWLTTKRNLAQLLAQRLTDQGRAPAYEITTHQLGHLLKSLGFEKAKSHYQKRGPGGVRQVEVSPAEVRECLARFPNYAAILPYQPTNLPIAEIQPKTDQKPENTTLPLLPLHAGGVGDIQEKGTKQPPKTQEESGKYGKSGKKVSELHSKVVTPIQSGKIGEVVVSEGKEAYHFITTLPPSPAKVVNPPEPSTAALEARNLLLFLTKTVERLGWVTESQLFEEARNAGFDESEANQAARQASRTGVFVWFFDKIQDKGGYKLGPQAPKREKTDA